MSRFVFLLGTGRCGSSLVHEVLARHADVGTLKNVEDRLGRVGLGAAGDRLYRALPPATAAKGRLRLAPSEGYRVLADRVSPALAAPVRDLVADDATPWLARRTREFFEGCAADHGSEVFLHKFTGWPRAGFLEAVWDDAVFVHVVRDGRAVASSLLQMPWWRGWAGPAGWTFGPLPAPYEREWLDAGRSFVTLAGLEWKVLLDAFTQARAASRGGRWLELRYEDVVDDPRAAFGRVLEHCGLARTPAFDRELARHRISAGRTDAFRRDLGPDHVRRLDASLGDHLRAHGYLP